DTSILPEQPRRVAGESLWDNSLGQTARNPARRMEQPLRSREIVLCLWEIVPRRMSCHGLLSPMALQRRADDGAHVPAGAGEHLADGALAQRESAHPSWF